MLNKHASFSFTSLGRNVSLLYIRLALEEGIIQSRKDSSSVTKANTYLVDVVRHCFNCKLMNDELESSYEAPRAHSKIK